MAKIIHVVGTMGAGKTTLIRGWMERHPGLPIGPNPRRPVGYVTNGGKVYVMGPYVADLQTCGCDANKDTNWNYSEVYRLWGEGLSVVYEGLFMMNHTRGLELARAVGVKNFHLLRLVTPLDDCRAGVKARRAAQGNLEPLPARFEDGLKGNDIRAKNYAYKMGQLGCLVHRVSREEALAKMEELLNGNS